MKQYEDFYDFSSTMRDYLGELYRDIKKLNNKLCDLESKYYKENQSPDESDIYDLDNALDELSLSIKEYHLYMPKRKEIHRHLEELNNKEEELSL